MKQKLRLLLMTLLCAVVGTTWAEPLTETITLSEQGYSNAQQVSSTEGTNFTITYNQGTSSNAPAYYNTGNGVRVYAGGNVVISSEKTMTKVVFTFAKNNSPVVKIGETTVTSPATWEGEDTNMQLDVTSAGHIRLQKVVVTFKDEGSTLPSPELAYTTTEVNKQLGDTAFTNPLTNPYDVTVTYSSSDTNVATVNANGKVTIEGAGTTTINAAFAGNDSYAAQNVSYTLKVIDPNAPGATADKPYTVEQARAAIDNNTGVTGVFATGFVSEIVTAFNSQYGNISYNISADGKTTSDQLLVYRGKGINGAFTSNNDVRVGDSVVVYGNLINYNSTYEFAEGNYLVFIKHNSKLNAGLAYATATVEKDMGDAAFTNPLTNPNNLTVTYTSSDEDVAIVDENTGEVSIIGPGTITITASSEETDDYEAGEASYTLTIVYSASEIDLTGKTEPITFTSLNQFIKGSGYNSYETAALTGSDGVTYKGWSAVDVMTGNKNCLQLKKTSGKLISPKILSDYGLKIEIVDSLKHMTIIVGEETSNVDSLLTASTEAILTLQANSIGYDVLKSITITPLTEKLKQKAELSFAEEAVSKYEDDDPFINVLTKPNDVSVVYSSSDEEVATVDEDGEVTIVGLGETTIKAFFAGNDDFYPDSASYTLTVIAKPVPGEGVKYELVTSTDEITSGKYLIVYVSEEGQAVAFDGSLETLDAVENTFDVTIENDIITTDQNNYFNIDVENGTLQSASGLYIGVTSNSNGLKQTEEEDKYTHTFSIDDNGYAVIAANFEGSTMTLRYNKATNQLRFRYYSNNGQQPIYLYKEVEEVEQETISVTIGDAGYATLYYSNKNLSVPEGVKAYTVTVEGSNIKTNDIGSVIPAGYGVVLEGAANTYDFKVTEAPATLPEKGALEGTDEATTISDGLSKYYVLSLNQNGDEGSIGFYYDPTTNPADGSSVNNGAHKAYLKVDASNSASAYPFNTTGIRSITTTAVDSGEVYTLSGIRVKGQLSKGIYIVNGKKMVIK